MKQIKAMNNILNLFFIKLLKTVSLNILSFMHIDCLVDANPFDVLR